LKTFAFNNPEKSATKSVAVAGFPNLTLIAISQADAALTISVFAVSAIIFRAARVSSGSSESHQSRACVSRSAPSGLQTTVRCQYIFLPSRDRYLTVSHSRRGEIARQREEQKRQTHDGRFLYNLGRKTNQTIGHPEAQDRCFSDGLNRCQGCERRTHGVHTTQRARGISNGGPGSGDAPV
jgi:hypothetical protein